LLLFPSLEKLEIEQQLINPLDWVKKGQEGIFISNDKEIYTKHNEEPLKRILDPAALLRTARVRRIVTEVRTAIVELRVESQVPVQTSATILGFDDLLRSSKPKIG